MTQFSKPHHCLLLPLNLRLSRLFCRLASSPINFQFGIELRCVLIFAFLGCFSFGWTISLSLGAPA